MATNTTNYGFKKPDESDFYDVADQNKNWDLADKILKNLDTPTFEDYTGSTAVPSATDAINQIKSKGKLGVLLANIKAAFKGACLIGHIVNNCVTDNAGLPLSAAQGKVLMDKYTQLYSELPKIVYLRDVGDIALSLSNINKEIVFFSLNGTDYSGSKPIDDDSFIYGTGYAVLRYDSYIGEVGYVKNYKFVYNVKNKQFKWL